MKAPISDKDWDWLMSRPRLMRTWDAAREGSTAALMISTLQMAEQAGDGLVIPLQISLGELRHHVQWCQIAGNVLETAKESQDYFFRLEHRIRSLDTHIHRLENLLSAAGVDPPPKPKTRLSNA